MTDDAIKAFAARCESIGRNCEFGFVQRKLGAEPMSLLRWAGGPMNATIRALRTEFSAIGYQMDFWKDAGGEWWGRTLGLTFHSGVPAHEPSSKAHDKERRRLPRLAQMLMETIRLGEKPLVYSSADLTSPEDAYPLLDALRSVGGYGPVLIVSGGGDEAVYPFDRNAWGARLPHLTGPGDAASTAVEPWVGVLQQFAHCRVKVPVARLAA